jgi:hypothetical protein
VRITVDLPDDLAAEIEQRAGDFTWSQLIVDALVYALAQADTQTRGRTRPCRIGRRVTGHRPRAARRAFVTRPPNAAPRRRLQDSHTARRFPGDDDPPSARATT